jgi:hypothetical protein
MTNYSEKMTELALSFPTLSETAQGVIDPWTDAAPVLRAIRGGGHCHGALCALRFVLSVWNPYEYGKKFDMHEALGVWDNEHRAAFLAWVKDPWWP